MSAVDGLHGDEVGELQRALFRVAETARQVDTRGYELGSGARVEGELVPRINSAVDDAVGVLGRLLERYDGPTEVSGPEDSGVFEAVFDEMVERRRPAPRPGQRVADVSFMARWELDRKRNAVATAQRAEDSWRLLAECCSARRRVVKATSGVEQVLSEVEGRPSIFEDLYRSERQYAIETRTAYHAFARDLRSLDEDDERVERNIRLVGIGLARLVGRDVYEDLRIKDRFEVRTLQRRLFDWLRSDRDPREGRRLLGDAQAFAALLMEVNRRAVLVLHDREVLRELQRMLRGPVQTSVDGAQLSAVLASLRGRDPELDDLIASRTELRAERWSPVIDRVLAEISEQSRD